MLVIIKNKINKYKNTRLGKPGRKPQKTLPAHHILNKKFSFETTVSLSGPDPTLYISRRPRYLLSKLKVFFFLLWGKKIERKAGRRGPHDDDIITKDEIFS